jgi:CBS domain-containing protein
MTVGELCIRQVAVVRKDETVVEAARCMREHHVGCVIVVEERSGEYFPAGILTDRDIVVSIVAKDPAHLAVLTVGDVMTSDLTTAREGESVAEVFKRMRDRSIRRVPVVSERGALQGVLSADDLIEYLCEELTDLAKLIAHQQRREKEERA